MVLWMVGAVGRCGRKKTRKKDRRSDKEGKKRVM